MKSVKVILVVAIAAVLIQNWLVTRPNGRAAAPGIQAPVSVESQALTGPAASPSPKQAAQPSAEAARAASRRDYANPLVVSYPPSTPPPRQAADSEPEVANDFDKISLMLRDYRTLAGENPVGTNAEMMQAIMGGNPKGARLGPPEGQSLNAAGELIDRWGTPYFFHQLGKDQLEIHSAGPDRRMGTEDDLISH